MVWFNNNWDFVVSVYVLFLGVMVIFFRFLGVFLLVLPLFLGFFSWWVGVISCAVCIFLASEMHAWSACSRVRFSCAMDVGIVLVLGCRTRILGWGSVSSRCRISVYYAWVGAVLGCGIC